MDRTFAVGVDIGGTNTDLGLVRDDGTIVARRNFSTCDFPAGDLYVGELRKNIDALVSDNSVKTEGIGIGAPNGNFFTGSVENASNVSFLNGVPLKGILEETFGVPVAVSNDANAAAFGEMVYGGAAGLQDFMTITFGTGVGSGIVVNGRLVLGKTGSAGELGHMVLVPEGRRCNCGRKGCLEEYASARGICKTFSELRSESAGYCGRLYGIPDSELTSKLIADAAQQGDPLAIETYCKTGYYTGLALANFVTFSSPQAIFLMGGPTKAGDVFLKPILKSFDEHLLSLYRGTVEVKLSQLPSNDVAILGAAALVKMPV